MAVSSGTIDKIRARVAIHEVIGDFVTLKQRGTSPSYWACCPFHSERTPSFSVHSTRGFYKCFGCGKAGDAIKFLEEKEGMGFLDAMRYLANKYGVEWEEVTRDEQGQKQQEARDLLAFANAYYRDNLKESQEARAYLRKRGISPALAEQFDLGYAPPDWHRFQKYAEKEGYGEEQLEQVGLLVRGERGAYDRLRGRIIFPLHSSGGRILGFSGRTIDPKSKESKYINPPQTAFYDKGSYLYGLRQAGLAIRKVQNVYLVEGYTDVLALHRAGIREVTSSSGTALTTTQATILKRYTPKVTLLFDADEAGEKAALRGIDLLLEAGVEAKIVQLPQGEDPDTYLQAHGAEKLQQYLTKQAVDFVTFRILKEHAVAAGNPEKRIQALEGLVISLAKIADPIRRAVYLSLAQNQSGIDEEVLQAGVEHALKKRCSPAAKKFVPFEKSSQSAQQASEEELLFFLLEHGEKLLSDGSRLADYLLEELRDVPFEHQQNQAILEVLYKLHAAGKRIILKNCMEALPEELRDLVVNITSEPFLLSEGWLSRYQISTPSIEEEKVLEQLVVRNLLHRKRFFIQRLLKEQRLRIAQAATEEERMHYCKRHAKIKLFDIEVGKRLESVVLPPPILN